MIKFQKLFLFSTLAYCKNPVTGKWYCYDDHLVSELDPSRVCTPDAYILFYRCCDTPPSPPLESITKSPSTHSQQQTDSTLNDIDGRLNLYYASNPQSLTIDDDSNWPSINDKQHHYTLQPPLPLPRKFLTPLPSSSSSQEEFSSVPCPMPRARKPQYSLDIGSLSSQIMLPPSPPTRRQPMTPPVNYVYPISSTPVEHIIEPLNDCYSSSQRQNPNTERTNPWNYYNSELDHNVVYQRKLPR